jgi:hypothetical protein
LNSLVHVLPGAGAYLGQFPPVHRAPARNNLLSGGLDISSAYECEAALVGSDSACINGRLRRSWTIRVLK